MLKDVKEEGILVGGRGKVGVGKMGVQISLKTYV
jgi:hypothetical protein